MTAPSAVDRTREQWIKNLIDLSRRNNLLYYRAVKGSFDLTNAPAALLHDFLAGKRVLLTDLLPDQDPTKLGTQARELQRRAQINQEEKGLQTLFLAYGMAGWPSNDGGRPFEAAVLLFPTSITARWRDAHSITLQRDGDPQLNLALLHLLATQYGCPVDPDELLALGVSNGNGNGNGNGTNGGNESAGVEHDVFDPQPVLARLLALAEAKRISGFSIAPHRVLNNFSFQKMAMVSDLQQHAEQFASHDVLAAITGDENARARVVGQRTEIDPRQLDSIPPDNEFLVLDADSSQQRVIQHVLNHQSGVIQGPPGTGKSQTIVNLIAALVANGYRVLFVAEKRVALEVVLNRLKRVGLGHLALDLHGAEISSASVARAIAHSMETISHSTPAMTAGVHPSFVDRRMRLNKHDAQMHTPRQPSGLSAYEMQGRLLRSPLEVRAQTRWRSPELDRLTKETAATLMDELRELTGIEQAIHGDTPPLWAGAQLADAGAAQQALDLARRIANQDLPALRAALETLNAETSLSIPNTPAEIDPFLTYLSSLQALLAAYTSKLFDEDLPALLNALAPATGLFSRLIAGITNSSYRQALARLRALRQGSPASPAQLHADVTLAIALLKVWQENATGVPRPRAFSPVANVRQQYQQLISDLQAITPALAGLKMDFMQAPLPTLAQVFTQLGNDDHTPYQVSRGAEIERQIRAQGGGPLLDEARAQHAPAQRWPLMFEFAWVASCFDKIRLDEPELAGFVGATHNQYVNEFSHLDRERITLAVQRVCRTHAERAIQAMNRYPAQEALVRREAEKKRRHLPLRKLLAQAPDVLTAVCPCWMTSPLSVSQLLGADRRYFDVVIFDEASQIPPEDAAPAILRAEQVVVAGDQHQLPPTRFFAAGEDDPAEEDEALASQGFESLLDLMTGFMGNWWLEWHYRSRDEALIAFSNHYIYRDRLITFPSTSGLPSLSHELIQLDPSTLPERDNQLYSSPAEVRKVVDLIINHARIHANESLGVITLGIRHAIRIEEELERRLPSYPELDAFFSQNRPEPFFIKNLERVQGDERDAIILTVGYSKNRVGKLPYRFGPLLTQGGERRLNVAITRARDRLTLVSSFSHYDMDPARSSAEGVKLLRAYLEYAAGQGKDLATARAANIKLNPFEEDVYNALTAKGIVLIPQWGASGYRIDFAAQHPQQPGRFVLAIECDGASYHSAPTARDRDRLRQQQLEALGWRFHRIWSTDWFLRREQEISRAEVAYRAAVERSDQALAARKALEIETPSEPAPSATPSPVEPAAPVTPAPTRATRPNVPRYTSIDRYPTKDLVALIRWINSDNLLRTDEEIIDEMVQELGFKRRGTRIEDILHRAIGASKLR